ncbi:MAG: hypothetical protein ACU85E_15535 [Gammaproteobacteria bacterium]
MSNVAIDRNTIKDLFENQKKMDELFDSIFNDDNYFIDSSYSSSQTGSRYSTSDVESKFSYGEDSVKKSFLAIRKNNPYYFVLPIVLEIAAIYLVVTNLL